MASVSFILQTIIFVLLEIVGISTNTITLYLLTSRKKCRESLKISPESRIILLNLTIMDLLAMTTFYPIMFITIQYQSWYFGWFMCKLIAFSQMASHIVITYTLSAIAIQWYNSPVMKPHKEPVSLKQCCTMLTVIWIMALFLSIPMFANNDLMTTQVNDNPLGEQIDEMPSVTENTNNFMNDSIVDLTFETNQILFNVSTVDVHMCVQTFDAFYISEGTGYMLQMFIVTHVVPFMICAFTYTRMAYRIWCKTLENLNRNDIKTVKMMLITTTAFMLLFIPFNLLNTSLHFTQSLAMTKNFTIVFYILSCLAEANVFYKPLIYICVNDNFGTAFRQVLRGKSSPEHQLRDDNENEVDQVDQMISDQQLTEDDSRMRYSILNSNSKDKSDNNDA